MKIVISFVLGFLLAIGLVGLFIRYLVKCAVGRGLNW